MPAHSKVGFSSRERWAACPGSVKLSEHIPSESSVYAREGTAAHALQEHCLTLGLQPRDLIGVDFVYDDHGEECAIVVTLEMGEAIQGTVDRIREALAEDPDAVLLVEEHFHLHQLHPDLFGTGDVAIWFPAPRKLQVRDLKYGAGIAVDVEDEDGVTNPQVEGYALGALLKFPDWRPVEVEIVIDQPRAYHSDGPTRSKTLPVSYFVDMAADLVDEVKRTEEAAAAFGPMAAPEWRAAYLVEGDHCRWCPANRGASCPMKWEKAQALAKHAFAPSVPYDADELATILDYLPVLEAWIKNTREFAYAEAEKGHGIPHYKLVAKEGRSKWREGIAAELAKKLGLTLADITEAAPLKGITEIKKLAPGKNDKERSAFLTDFTVKESSGHALVHESDKRDAIRVDAAAAFADR